MKKSKAEFEDIINLNENLNSSAESQGTCQLNLYLAEKKSVMGKKLAEICDAEKGEI